MNTFTRATLATATALTLTAVLAPATQATRAAPSTVLDVRGLDRGAPPAIAWSERRAGKTVIHGTDGTRTPAPNRLVEVAPMGVDTATFQRGSAYEPWPGSGPLRIFSCGRLNP